MEIEALSLSLCYHSSSAKKYSHKSIKFHKRLHKNHQKNMERRSRKKFSKKSSTFNQAREHKHLRRHQKTKSFNLQLKNAAIKSRNNNRVESRLDYVMRLSFVSDNPSVAQFFRSNTRHYAISRRRVFHSDPFAKLYFPSRSLARSLLAKVCVLLSLR
jgi:hypothetical protein